jgi:hypothetical protein
VTERQSETAVPSTIYLWTACCTIEAAHEEDDLAKARQMLSKFGLTYETAIAELELRGAIGR